MADSDVMREFLVRIGYAENESSRAKVLTSIEAIGKKFAAFAVAIEANAAAVVAGIAKIATGMESLYFASQRTGAAVQNIQSFGFAVTQMGGSVEGARGSLEALGRFMRVNPGGAGFLRNLGVTASDTSEMMEQLADKFRAMPYYRANYIASFLGIDERTLQAMLRGVDEFGGQYRSMLRAAGVDSKQAAADSHSFMVELRTFGAAFDILGQKIEATLAREIGGDIANFRRLLVDNFDSITRVIVTLARAVIWVSALLTHAVGSLVTMARAAWDWFGRLDGRSKMFITTLGGLLVAWRVLGASLLATPFGVVIAGLAALFLMLDDFMAWQRGAKHVMDWDKLAPQLQALFAGIWAAIKPLKDGLDSITSIFGVWQPAAEAFLVFMGIKFVPAMLGYFARIFAAAAGGGAAAGAAGGGLIGWLLRGLRVAGPLGAFLWTMRPSQTNGGRNPDDPSESAETRELRERHLQPGRGTPAPADATKPGWGNIGYYIHRAMTKLTTLANGGGETASPEGQALLDQIAVGESGGRYNVRYSPTGDKTFDDMSHHPRIAEPTQGGANVSTAAGKYQFTATTWDEMQKLRESRGLGQLPDFSPKSQEIAGWFWVQEIYRRHFPGHDLTADLKAARGNAGALAEISNAMHSEWTSAPGGSEPNRATGGFVAGLTKRLDALPDTTLTPYMEALRSGAANTNISNAASNVASMGDATLGPAVPIYGGDTSNSADRTVVLTQKTDIHLSGVGKDIALEVADRQSEVNNNLVRVARVAYR